MLPLPPSAPTPAPRPTPTPPSAAESAQAARAATPPQGALRMPPARRLQRTEFLPVPTAYQAPIGRSSSEWPIVATYARVAWRIDEFGDAGQER